MGNQQSAQDPTQYSQHNPNQPQVYYNQRPVQTYQNQPNVRQHQRPQPQQPRQNNMRPPQNHRPIKPQQNPSAFKQYGSQHNQTQNFVPNNQVVKNYHHNQPLTVMNVNDRIQQFNQRELSEEEQFQLAQERLREVFKKKQEERRRRFYAEVESFEKGRENPYHILGVSMNVDQTNLKKAYKKMAVQYHPDKGGNPEIFKKITQAYIYVLDKLEKSKRMNRTFEEAKQEFEKPNDEYIDKQVEQTVKKFKLDKDNFNLNKFNQIFDEFRISDPNDKGYGQGWEDENENENNQAVFNQKFNKDVFNQVFDENNEKRQKKYSGKGTIMNYEEPQAQVSLNTAGLGFAEIGVDDILNFTGNSGNLNFTDYKAAYTYESTIEKPEMNRKEYKNVKELEAERDNISYNMSAEEKKRQQAIKDYNDKLEEQRRMNMERYDNRVQDQYRRIHSNLITN